jgi:sRNA-binding protein
MAAISAILKPRNSFANDGIAKPVKVSILEDTQGRISHPIKNPRMIVRR